MTKHGAKSQYQLPLVSQYRTTESLGIVKPNNSSIISSVFNHRDTRALLKLCAACLVGEIKVNQLVQIEDDLIIVETVLAAFNVSAQIPELIDLNGSCSRD